jgi:hypothetical protein
MSFLIANIFLYILQTDVMITVAKSFDGPIKILFPRVSIFLYPQLLLSVFYYS